MASRMKEVFVNLNHAGDVSVGPAPIAGDVGVRLENRTEGRITYIYGTPAAFRRLMIPINDYLDRED